MSDHLTDEEKKALSNDPANWAQSVDKRNGKTYYYNKKTKETSWNKPKCMGGEQKKWVEAKDPKTGRTYYYDKSTKTTTWVKPKELGGPDEQPRKSKSSSAATESSDDKAKEKPAEEAAAKKPKSDWREATDPKSGRTYWYNKKTQKTTWKNPLADGAEDKPKKESKPEPEKVVEKPAAKKRFVDSEDDDDEADTGGGDDDDDGDEEDQQEREQQMAKLKEAFDDQQDDGEEEDGEEDDGGHEFKFAKHRHGWLNRTFRMGETYNEAQLLTFKKSLIKKALLKQNRDLDNDAVQAFKNVMSYMGDRKSSKPPVEHARKLLRNIMVAPIGIRDELYMQLCKQTTQNPRIASTIKGWELMVFCVATFPPSKNLKSFLLDFIKKTIKENINEQITKLAHYCQTNLPKIVLMGQRKQVPSKQEIQCLIALKQVPIRVKLCNETFKTMEVNSYTLVNDIQNELIEKYNLTCHVPFALYEAAEANIERILDPKDRILDVLASWENRAFIEELKEEKEVVSKRKTQFDKHKDAGKKVKKIREEAEYNSFLYKAKLVLKTSNKEIMSDSEAVTLIYIQATQDVVTNRYPSQDKDVAVLAALQLQATFGDFNKEMHTGGWLAPKISEYIPKHLIVGKNNQVQDHMVKEWERKILDRYKKVAGFTQLDAKLNYLDYVQEWIFYGATFFEVEQRQFKDYPSPLTLGINCEGVLLMHPEKKTVLENYEFTAIVTWGHSDEKFIVVVGNILQQRKLIFKTNEGKHMNHLIHDYVKFKVKSKV